VTTEPYGQPKPTCFIAMPITTHPAEAELYGDVGHWEHVMEALFVKAIEAAGFAPIRPVAVGAHLIHGQIIHHLSRADLVLCDLSSHNPNVFFELGVRTSINLPVALVRDTHTALPFDLSGINTYEYKPELRGWEIEEEQRKLTDHIRDSAASCNGTNPMWKQFGLTIRAEEPNAQESPLEAKIDLMGARMVALQNEVRSVRRDRVELLEVERELEATREENQLLLRHARPEARLLDLERGTGFSLFESAVRRFSKQNHLNIEVAALNANAAMVMLNTSDGAVADRILSLGKTYEVDVELIGPTDGVRRVPRTSPSKASARSQDHRPDGRE